MKFCMLFLAVLLITISPSLLAQKAIVNSGIDSTVKTMTALLQTKILLSDKQTGEISAAILNWLNDKEDLEVKTVLNNIKSILDLHQRSKFQIIKDEWWDNLIHKINSIGFSKKLNSK